MNAENSSSTAAPGRSRTTSVRAQLLKSLQDREYRHAFLEEHVRAFIALQVRASREQRDLTQAALGKVMGKAQAWISQLENPEYGKVSVATLLELAEAFDTALRIKFVPFSELLDRVAERNPNDFTVASFIADDFTRGVVSSGSCVSEATAFYRPSRPPRVQGTRTRKTTPIDTAEAWGGQRVRERPQRKVTIDLIANGSGA